MRRSPFEAWLNRTFEIRWESRRSSLPPELSLPLSSLNADTPSIATPFAAPRVNPELTAGDAESTRSGPAEDIDPWETAEHRWVIGGREFRLAGNSLLCACPDCGAPLGMRVWLGLAECWRCECLLELSTAELAELRQRLPATGLAAESELPRTPDWSAAIVPPARLAPAPGQPHIAIPHPATTAAGSELEAVLQRRTTVEWLADFWSSLPAWSISFLVHLLVILILALLVFQNQSSESLRLVLSTFLDRSRTEGGIVQIPSTEAELADDLLPTADDPEAREWEEARAAAAEIVNDPQAITQLPDLEQVKGLARLPGTDRAALAARDPRLRQEIIEQAGGTTQSEAAVARGLRWLASVQNRDGSWSLANYERHDRPDNTGDAAATSLALLPFLGAGQTSEFGKYKGTVARGLAWLIENQKANGDLRINFPGQAGLYAHGQATICLCEAYALTGDERFRDPAARAIQFIERAQHSGGGWRYEPGQPGDTSVFGWQLMALQSARATPLAADISPDTWRLADYYLDTASQSQQHPAGALYRYQPDSGPFTASMTSEAALCRMYLGWKRDDPRLMYAVNWLLKNHLPNRDELNLYYWYYGTQVMHHWGGEPWERWNNATRDLIVGLQQTSGRHPGSWNPRQFEWGAQGERIFVTSLAICTLEVYYRHLPLFHPLDLK